MKFIKKFVNKYFSNDMDVFANRLGYCTWSEAKADTFHIFIQPPDLDWYITKLPDNSWAVWNEEGDSPFAFQIFPTWYEAIRTLRNVFEEGNIPEEYWGPEGYENGDDPFSKLPDKSKKIKF
ncbi:hypothetical protein [Bacillus thuringiensis]|uniref:hypothetical protein n=1 Tax=Bacillus thuringiensis TaxID=1428 RepID=UPI0005CF7747|nr:hypothetical protein [Bacillus thuringiensis]